MAKYLVIVESPAKVKTIKKFLGSNYDVQASNGHVRDFPKSQFGIDIENDFEPKYITIRGEASFLAGLRKAAKKADKIFLATDPDREGEAISWHLMQALKEDPGKMRRITFNEITKTAVKNSIKQPGSGYESGRRPAGKKNAGSYGRIQHQPSSLGQGKKRVKRRPCSVSGSSYHLRQGGGDQLLYS